MFRVGLFSCIGFVVPLITSDFGRAQNICPSDVYESAFINSQIFNFNLTADSDSSFYSKVSPCDTGINRSVQIFHSKADRWFDFRIFPLVTTLVYNSERPYGINDGVFWSGKGFSSGIYSGIALTSPFLTLQTTPHLYSSQNLEFNSGYGLQSEIGVDLPYRFGTKSVHHLSWENTSLKLHYKWFEIGVGKESLWWGPSTRNPMSISTQGPGLKQLFVGTREPIELPVKLGELQFRTIWSKLETTRFFYDQTERFMTGFNLAFSPEFISGFTIGVTRLFQSAIIEGKISRSQLLDPFETFMKVGLPNYERRDKVNKGDQMATIYAQLLFSEGKGKIYGEYAREDHNWDFRDAIINPHNSRGFIFGALKSFKHVKKEITSTLLMEFTNTSGTSLDQVRSVQPMYIGVIKAGHTNEGQMIGAAIGPSSTSSFIGYYFTNKHGHFGLTFERIELNEFAYFENRDAGYIYESNSHRLTLNYGLQVGYELSRISFLIHINGNHYLNDLWSPNRDFWNYHSMIKLAYKLDKN